jgi:DNA-binding transcriptional regulator LsrR (DeoR family)
VGPDEQVRLAFIANRFYRDGKTRIEIAEELGLSRFKVGRMLEAALASGIVTISIEAPGAVDLELSLELQRRFGLRRAIAVRTPTEETEQIQQDLGAVSATLLTEVVRDDSVLGVTAGRTMRHVAQHLSNLALCDVVQLSGVAGPIQSSGIEIVGRISRVSGGTAYSIYAPLVCSDVASARAIRRQPDLQRTLDQFSRVTVAMVAIGSWSPPDSQVYYNAAISPGLRERLLARGVQAEVCATLLDSEGAVLDDLTPLSIAIETEQLRRIPEVIGVAGGPLKTAAVRAALESGLLTSLVTDAALARRLLAA